VNRRHKPENSIGLLLLSLALAWLAGSGTAAAVSIDPSQRYYQDGSGKPVFLIGYYGWAAVPDGYFIDHPSRYATTIQRGAPYKINYIRVSLSVNHFTSSTTPQSWNNQPTPVPFAYVNGKANLDQWDAAFWTGLQNQCALAQQNGVIVMISIFDGVEIRGNGGAAYGYANSFWNPANQTASFYADPDFNHNGQIDDGGEFYQTSNFTNNVGLGKYQRMLIAQAISTTASYSNVLFEVGNELGASDPAWYSAVIAYAKTLTSKPITEEQNFVCGSAACGRTGNLDGWSEHVADTPAQVKANVAQIVGHGVPAWEDPDGPLLSDANVSSDDLRKAAWYSFAGGAAGWGGFTVDYWSFGHGFNDTTTCYYRKLQSFIQDSSVQFWNMVPNHSLVSNSASNSCLARTGEYVVYVLRDASVTVDLTGLSGTVPYRLFDPRAGTWTASQNITGGAVRTFNKPAGSDDWVIYIGNGTGSFAGSACPVTQQPWSILGTQQTLGDGVTPGVATDSQGNIHVVYMNNGAIYYRRADATGFFGAPELIPVPEGAANYNSPHVVCDTNGDPHVVFERDWYPSTSKCWYSNRKGGSWKTPVLAFNGLLVMYSRLVLYGTNAFVTASTGDPAGLLARLSNLSGTPHLDLTNGTYLFGPYPVIDSSGRLFVIGRNSGSGHYLQQYDRNLNAVGGGIKISTSTPNKTGEPTAAVIDGGNRIHAIGNCGATGIDPESSSDLWYNNSVDGSAPAQGSVLGLAGPGWMGQVVYPHTALDAKGTIYLAYRSEATGEGKISVVSNGQFAEPVTFTPAITDPNTAEQRRWNCQLAPARFGGVYVTWDYAGKCYIRPIGITGPPTGTLNIKAATGAITIDGDPADWSLADFTTLARAGQGAIGDTALVGYDGGTLYYSGYYTGATLPVNAADHTAKVYGRHDADYLYFLARLDDADIRFPNPVGMNWANDCVEFYIDPGFARGATPLNNSSSDIQLVIDANNQKNVYACTAAYTSQVLNGVDSAVTRDATGWWLEARIAKNALTPPLPAAGGSFGLDFNFRDNDNNNDPLQTTVYTWSDNSTGGGFPSKIPDKWGTATAEPLEVSIDLGSPDILNGMTDPQNADGNTTAVAIGGRTARQNVNTNVDLYFYFGVSAGFAFGNKPDVYILVDYFDAGAGSLSLQYDSNTGNTLSAFYKSGGSVSLAGSNTWKEKVFHVTDAWFGRRQNAGADFRIGKSGGGFFYLDTIRVVTPQHPPVLRATRAGNTVVISWPTSTVGFVLQSENALAATNWTDVTSPPVAVAAENTVTNLVANTNKFFRMRNF